MKRILQIALKLGSGGLAIGILGAAGWFSLHLINTPVKAPRERVKPSIPVVGVAELKTADHPISVEAFGTVVAARELTLRPEVRGRVTALHPQLQVGGLVRKGEVLVEIASEDFEIAVRRAEAALAEVEVEWKIEQGRQAVAKREWELLKGRTSADAEKSALALRQPQLQKVEAMRARAQADLETAKLNVARTEIAAPFDAVILSESAEIGQLLDTNTQIARLVGTEEFWVEALVPLRRLSLIWIPEGEFQGASVQIQLDTGDEPIARTGRVLRRLADLDAEGRMARVLVSIRDPLNLDSGELRGLPLGSYVRLSIDAGKMEDLISIPRVALRENDRLWIRDQQGRLQIRDVDVIWRRDEDVLISDRFESGEHVITTHLAGIIPGTPVRARGEANPAVLTKHDQPKERKPES